MPDTISYDATKRLPLIGRGWVDNVEPAVWQYEVSGKQVLVQWFSYRKRNRERPLIGDRRPPSPLGNIQPDHWLAEYTTELLNVLNVLGRLVDLKPAQADLLNKVCAGPVVRVSELREAGVFAPEINPHVGAHRLAEGDLFSIPTRDCRTLQPEKPTSTISTAHDSLEDPGPASRSRRPPLPARRAP